MAKLEFAESGAGGRPFMLVHGFTGAKEDFTEWLDPLAAAGWHAVAPDNLGHGSSEKPESEDDYTFDALADALVSLADDRWGSGSPFVLLGHSMGGMVAQVLALRAPERITALVLMDTLPGPLPFVQRDDIDLAKLVVREQGIDGLAVALQERGGPLDSPAHLRLLAERPGYAEFNDRKFRDTAPAAYAGLLEAMFVAPDRLAALRTLSMPTLVITGEQDRPIVEPSQQMASAIPGAELAVIAAAGHSPQFENADAWWNALSTFLARVGSRV
ncbi:MAG TPA: alpha/beta hydrolase [Acidimicrobiales bacterium]|nr:alpha/beta hydrolase [Acidimicrobiales bacterium]